MMKTLALPVLLAVGALLPVAAAAQTPTYEIHAESSFGTTFTDCLGFDFPGGTLNIDGLGSPLTLSFGDLDTDRSRFKAVTRITEPSTFFEIMFFGKLLNFGRIKGEALNEFHDTFIFSGVRNDSCPKAAIGSARKWSSR
jgi:hypothetical protein